MFDHNIRQTIIQGDSLEVLKDIKDNSQQLIILDPPYNLQTIKKVKTEWDIIGTNTEYIDFIGKVIAECSRVLAPSGSLYIFHNKMPVIFDIYKHIIKNSPLVYKQFITWCKVHKDFDNYGFSVQRLCINEMRNFYGGFTEYILYFTLQGDTDYKSVITGKDCFKPIKDYLSDQKALLGYNNTQINELLNTKGMAGHYFSNSQWQLPSKKHYEMLQGTGYFAKPYEELKTEYEKLKYVFNTINVKADLYGNSNVWLYPPAKSEGHITPKPLDLIKNIILHSTNEGDNVLDPFAGSGTTAVACEELNRSCICIEREQEFVELGKSRLNNGQAEEVI